LTTYLSRLLSQLFEYSTALVIAPPGLEQIVKPIPKDKKSERKKTE